MIGSNHLHFQRKKKIGDAGNRTQISRDWNRINIVPQSNVLPLHHITVSHWLPNQLVLTLNDNRLFCFI